MNFKVPKFLERESKIFSFLTFKQLALLGGAGMILVVIYYIAPKGLFFILLFIAIATAFSLLFIKIEGLPIGQLAAQFFGYFIGSKKYFWQKRKTMAPVELKKEEPTTEEKSSLKMAPESRLGKISNKIQRGL